MTLTVREALALEGVRRLQLVGGEAGLERLIQHVTVLEVPDAEKWLRGGEFLITAFYTLRGSLDNQLNLMRFAARKQCAGLAILSHPEGYDDSLPRELIAEADTLALPLFVMPRDVAYIDVIAPIYREIVSRQARSLEYAMRAHQAMTQAVFAGRTLQDLVLVAARLVESPVAVMDRWGQVVASADPRTGDPLSERLLVALQTGRIQVSHLDRRRREPGGGEGRRAETSTSNLPRFFGYRIRAGSTSYGEVLVAQRDATFTDLHLMALEQSCTVLAFWMEKAHALEQAQARLQRDLLDELLSGSIDEGLLGRAREVGWSVETKRVVMLVRAYALRDDTGRQVSAAHSSDFTDAEYRSIAATVEGQSPGHVTVRKGDGVVLLYDAAPEADAREVRRQVTSLAAALARQFESPRLVARIGIGGLVEGPAQLRRSYAEARTALAVGTKLLPARLVWHIDDIAGYQFLAQGFSANDRKSFVDSVLGPLLVHDQRRQGELVKTLKIYMEQLGSTSSAARALFVHRNTLGYRLKRITALLGYDPVSLPQRTTVEIALALWTMMADDAAKPDMGTLHKFRGKFQTA